MTELHLKGADPDLTPRHCVQFDVCIFFVSPAKFEDNVLNYAFL